jgi:hypothetical protein
VSASDADERDPREALVDRALEESGEAVDVAARAVLRQRFLRKGKQREEKKAPQRSLVQRCSSKSSPPAGKSEEVRLRLLGDGGRGNFDDLLAEDETCEGKAREASQRDRRRRACEPI